MLPEYLKDDGTFGAKSPLLAKTARAGTPFELLSDAVSLGMPPGILTLQVAVRDQFHAFFFQDIASCGQGQYAQFGFA